MTGTKTERAGATAYGQLFTLVENDGDPTPDPVVFAWGVQITTASERFAVVFGGRDANWLLGLHDSADAACARHSHMYPLAVVWAGSRTDLSIHRGTTDIEGTVFDRV